MTRRSDAKIGRAVSTGLQACDLFSIAEEDILRRPHLTAFLKAALAYLDKEDAPQIAPKKRMS